MKRRSEASVPDRLTTFVAADWPAENAMAAFELWVDARRAWAEKHGWPGGISEAAGIDAVRQTPDEEWCP